VPILSNRTLFLLLFFILPVSIFGLQDSTVFFAKVSQNTITQGESIRLDITAIGEDIKFSDIDTICGSEILQSGLSQSAQNINGVVTSKQTKSYIFAPKNSCTISSFKAVINSKEYETTEIPIVVNKPQQTIDELFSAEMKVDKESAYVGEEVRLSIIFKRRSEADVVDLRFEIPEFKGFWVKKLGDEQKYREGDYLVSKQDLLIFPQKSGKLEIPNTKVLVGIPSTRRDMFGFFASRPEYKSIYSNDLIIEAKEIPGNLSLVGEYKISFKLDKYEASPKEPINGKIIIEGFGNIDDIPDIKLKAEGATIYEEQPLREYKFENNRHGGKYQKNMVFISDKSFVIEGVVIPYFDITTQSAKELRLEDINVEIKSNIQDENKSAILNSTKTETIDTDDTGIGKYFIFIIGFGLGMVFGFLAFKIASSVKQRKGEMKKFELFKKRDKKGILQDLLSLSHKDSETQELIGKLEDEIYNGKVSDIQTKELYKILKKRGL